MSRFENSRRNISFTLKKMIKKSLLSLNAANGHMISHAGLLKHSTCLSFAISVQQLLSFLVIQVYALCDRIVLLSNLSSITFRLTMFLCHSKTISLFNFPYFQSVVLLLQLHDLQFHSDFLSLQLLKVHCIQITGSGDWSAL